MSKLPDIPIMSTYDRMKDDFARSEFRKIIIAVVILLVASLSYYFYIRNWTLIAAEKRTENTLKNTENLVRARLGKMETIVADMQYLAEYAIDEPSEMFNIAHHMVESSPYIMGADISFKEFYYPQKGRWFEAYAGYQKGSDSLIVKQIGGKSHDYTKMEWFEKGLAKEKGNWSNPYYDNAGGKTRLMTYSLPIHDRTGSPVGVISADISLDTLASLIRSIKIYPNSFCTLVTESGEDIVPPPADHYKGKCHVFSNSIQGRNMVLKVTVPDSDMYKHLHRTTLVFAVLGILGLVALFFIAYRFVRNLQKLSEVAAREQRIEGELAVARGIQESLLPKGELPDKTQSVDICGLQVPARFVGGDLYDYYARDNKLFFCIGDVSGKGVPAAMLMAIAHSQFRAISAHSDSPEQIMRELNLALSDNNPDMMFITMFMGILDLDTGLVRYCNAGHNPPIWVRNGHPEYLSTEPSLLLGVEPEADYSAYELVLAPGDSLFLYTDGLTEAENINKELFGEQRTIEVAAEFGKLTSEKQIDRMHVAVRQFVAEAEQSDDLTLLVVRSQQTKETLTLNNDLQELSKLKPFLDDTFRNKEIPSSIQSQLELALEEAVTNVIMYAYPKGEHGTLTLSIDNTADGLVRMELQDQGQPFNPLQHQEANLDVSLDERQIGGLGIHLIKEIMDKVEYAYRGGSNLLRMERRIV